MTDLLAGIAIGVVFGALLCLFIQSVWEYAPEETAAENDAKIARLIVTLQRDFPRRGDK